jgi:hypothetical protein
LERFAAGVFAAARLTAYAIATLWATGLPALTSAFTFSRKALGEDDLTKVFMQTVVLFRASLFKNIIARLFSLGVLRCLKRLKTL